MKSLKLEPPISQGVTINDSPNPSFPLSSVGTVLYCLNWKECVEFYQRLLNCPPVFQNELFVEFVPVSGARIGLMNVSRTRRRVTPPESIVISLQVSSLERAQRFLKSIFEDLPDPVYHSWGVNIIELRDPDGRLVEIWEAVK